MFRPFYNVIFSLNNQLVVVQAKFDELFAEVALRYMQKAGLTEEDNIKFFFNSKELRLDSDKTLSDFRIMADKTEIKVIYYGQIKGGPPDAVGPIITINFRKGQERVETQAGSDNLLAGFFQYINYCFNKEKLHFFFNSSELIDKNKTFAYYKINDNSIIDVKDCESNHCKICCSNLISKIKKEKDEEKYKNEQLLIENSILRKNMENFKIENIKLKESVKKLEGLLNNNKQSEYSITSINPGEKILAVNFVSEVNNDINHYNLICKNVDLFVSLEKKY